MIDGVAMIIQVELDEQTAKALVSSAAEQHLDVRAYAAGLLEEAMRGEWVSVSAIMETADEIRSRRFPSKVDPNKTYDLRGVDAR